MAMMGQLHEKRKKEKEKLGGKVDRCIDTTGNSENSINQSWPSCRCALNHLQAVIVSIHEPKRGGMNNSPHTPTWPLSLFPCHNPFVRPNSSQSTQPKEVAWPRHSEMRPQGRRWQVCLQLDYESIDYIANLHKGILEVYISIITGFKRPTGVCMYSFSFWYDTYTCL